MLSRGPKLDSLVLNTLKQCAEIVGSSLGPGGRPVVIERQETNVAPVVTKDGVTIFRALGFDDPTAHVLMELARDAAIRTASDAGDGTTSCTILSYSIAQRTQEFCREHPQYSPQRVVRILEKILQTVILPEIARRAIKPTLDTSEGRSTLGNVAKLSANGDQALANAVMECYDLIGDEGNVTISEESGKSEYRVEKIDGYPILTGFEECCGPFFNEFINDHATQSSRLNMPHFLVHFGEISEYGALYVLLDRLSQAAQAGDIKPAIVLVATKFSEDVLSQLAINFKSSGFKVFPLKAPMTGTPNSQFEFLRDIAALTGATITDPINIPLVDVQVEHLGNGPTVFECGRYRTNILGYKDELLVLERVAELQTQMDAKTTSEYDRIWIRERIAKMSSGIARLIVSGSSNGETKEKRDRAEDAICAVRGALKSGALPGGGAFLKHLSGLLVDFGDEGSLERQVANAVFAPALLRPIQTLYSNAGLTVTEAQEAFEQLSIDRTYDISEGKMGDPLELGILDSVPAVRDAITNSLSIASLLGTSGGTVCFKRDHTLEQMEAQAANDYERDLPPAAVNI